MGRLTRDPETRYTPKGTAVADISIATNRTITDDQGNKREEVTYVDVTLWGKTAEVAQQYLAKGRGVFIEGRLQLDTWDDQQTGQKRSRLKVIGEHLEFLPGSKPAQGQAEASGESKPANHKRQAPAPRPQPQGPALPEDEEPSDIPFRSTIYRDVRQSKLNRRVF
jgi:single-strand DNA-binding protein